jgi:hypothetical protein
VELATVMLRCQRQRHLPAQPQKKRAQALQVFINLRTQPHKKRVKAMWRIEHLAGQPQTEELVQATRQRGGVGHL